MFLADVTCAFTARSCDLRIIRPRGHVTTVHVFTAVPRDTKPDTSCSMKFTNTVYEVALKRLIRVGLCAQGHVQFCGESSRARLLFAHFLCSLRSDWLRATTWTVSTLFSTVQNLTTAKLFLQELKGFGNRSGLIFYQQNANVSFLSQMDKTFQTNAGRTLCDFITIFRTV